MYSVFTFLLLWKCIRSTKVSYDTVDARKKLKSNQSNAYTVECNQNDFEKPVGKNERTEANSNTVKVMEIVEQGNLFKEPEINAKAQNTESQNADEEDEFEKRMREFDSLLSWDSVFHETKGCIRTDDK